MKKQLMTIAAVAIGVLAVTNLSTTANAGILSAGLQSTAEAVQQDNVVTKVGGRRHRSHRRHRGHRRHHRGWRWHNYYGYNYYPYYPYWY